MIQLNRAIVKGKKNLLDKLYRLEVILGMHRSLIFMSLLIVATILLSVTIIMILLPSKNVGVKGNNNNNNFIVNDTTIDVMVDYDVTEPIVIPKHSTASVKAVYAGRYATSEKSEYDMLGLPKDRKWLTATEWRGDHLTDPSIKSRFKMWQALHIQEFISYMRHLVKKERKSYPDIPEELYIAQAIIESNFGLSRLSVNGNNVYGHKCHSCTEDYIIAHDDSPTDRFQIKKSKWHSMRGHSKLLMGMYRDRISGKPTLKKWFKALCGCTTVKGSQKFRARGNKVYATSCFKDPGYINKLKKIIKAYKL